MVKGRRIQQDFGGIKEGRKSKLKVFLLLLLLFVFVAVVPIVYVSLKYYNIYFEQESPKIRVIQIPRAVGTEPARMILEVSDGISGLDEIKVQLENRSGTKDLLRRRYWDKKLYKDTLYKDTVELDFLGKDPNFKEGRIKLAIKVYDKAFLSNSATESFNIPIDLALPKVQPLSVQHNGIQGGSQIAVYRATDDNLESSGVEIRGVFYPGLSLAQYSPEFEKIKNAYAVIYPIPIDFNDASETIRLYARDVGGNTSFANFYYKARDIRYFTRRPEVSWEFLDGQVRELYQQYVREYLDGHDPLNDTGDFAEMTRIVAERFKMVNETYRAKTEEKIKKILSGPIKAKLWQDAFTRYGGTQLVLFGERRELSYEGMELGSFVNPGVDFAAAPQISVMASNSGVVAFSGTMGVYGNMVIIEHGFGLASCYAYLVATNVAVGERIEKGAVIGKAGLSGFSPSSRFQYQLRAHGVPVAPIEWWDQRWVKDHIESKIEQAKKDLGIITIEPQVQ